MKSNIFISRLASLFLFFFGIFFFLSKGVVFANSMEVKAFDSIAGYGTEIVIKNGESKSTQKIIIQSMKGSVSTYSVVLDAEGNASFVVPADDLQIAGEYNFTVVDTSSSYADGIIQQFVIYADELSVAYSQVYVIDNSVKTGKKAKVTAILYDRFQNPVSGHRVKLYSDRPADSISYVSSDVSSEDGEVSFYVSSYKAGVSNLVVKDETFDSIISSDIQIQFYTPLNSEDNNYGADITDGDDTSRVARFKIKFPDVVTLESDENYLELEAVDADGNIVEDFEGSILMQVQTDKNVVLPGDNGVYTFSKNDQGKILFSRSVIFSLEGKHQLEVYKYDKAIDDINYNIFGKKTVTVEKKKTGGGSGNTNEKVKIITPSKNAEFSSKDILVTGIGLPYSDVKIVLDGTPVLEASVDASGKFKGLLRNVSDGEHTVVSYQKQDALTVSEDVIFTVDTTVSTITSGVFSPHVVIPEEKVTVIVNINDDSGVKKVEITINDKKERKVDAKSMGNGKYQAVFPAPDALGEYTISAIVTDRLENIGETVLSPKLTVKIEEKQREGIKNLQAKYNTETKVTTLSWDFLVSPPLVYIVHSGVKNDKDSLKKIKTVSKKTNTAELEDLAPGKYYFQITAMDNAGKEDEKSEIISFVVVKPTPTPTPATPTPTPTPATPTPTPTATPIPATPTPVPVPKIFLTNKEEAIAVGWERYKNRETQKYVKNYKLYYGLSSHSYAQEEEISNVTSFRMKDLIPHVKYYISIDALGENGEILFSYSEVVGIPLESSFHKSPENKPMVYPEWVVQTGPRLFLFLGGIFLMFSAFFLFLHRRQEKF